MTAHFQDVMKHEGNGGSTNRHFDRNANKMGFTGDCYSSFSLCFQLMIFIGKKLYEN